MSGSITALSNITYPSTNITNKFFKGKVSLNLLLDLTMSLISKIKKTSNQTAATIRTMLETSKSVNCPKGFENIVGVITPMRHSISRIRRPR